MVSQISCCYTALLIWPILMGARLEDPLLRNSLSSPRTWLQHPELSFGIFRSSACEMSSSTPLFILESYQSRRTLPELRLKCSGTGSFKVLGSEDIVRSRWDHQSLMPFLGARASCTFSEGMQPDANFPQARPSSFKVRSPFIDPKVRGMIYFPPLIRKITEKIPRCHR